MPKAVVPKDLYVGFQMRVADRNRPSADGGKHVALGFLTYRNEKGQLQHKDSFDKWRDKDIPRIPLDNEPTTGMIAIGFATRYSTSNKLIRIEDPRNFQVEITVENFMDIVKNVTMVEGVIQDEMAWGWDGKLRLFKVGADDYLEAKANFEYGGRPTIPVKEVALGSDVMLANGKRGLYCGGWHVVDAGWCSDYDAYFDGGRGKDVKTKRQYILQLEDGSFERWSSIQIKHVFSEGTWSKENVELMLQSEVGYSVEREIRKTRANKEIKRLGISNDYGRRKDREKVYNKFGLNDGGYSLSRRPDMRWSTFRHIYAINSKPIKQEWFEEYINKKIEEVKWT